MDLIILVLGVISIFLQFFAAYFGYEIYRFNKFSKWWLCLVFAFLIQGIRRIFTVFEDLGLISFSVGFDRILMFMISILIVIGLWQMYTNFRNFNIAAQVIKKNVQRLKKNA